MKVAVVYYSEGGNTEALARAIHDAIEYGEKQLLPLMDVGDLGSYDLVFFGFPVQTHSVPVPAQKVLRTVSAGQKVALFSTHGSFRGGPLAVTAFHNAMTVAQAADVVGTFGCQGRVKPAIIEAVINMPQHRGWALEAQGALGHPDRADLEDAADFARLMVAKAQAV
jgi:flavodoxin